MRCPSRFRHLPTSPETHMEEERELTSTYCPLTFMYAPRHVHTFSCTPFTHTRSRRKEGRDGAGIALTVALDD